MKDQLGSTASASSPVPLKLKNPAAPGNPPPRQPHGSTPWNFVPGAVKITCPSCGYAVPTGERCTVCRSALVKTSRLAVMVAIVAVLAVTAAVLRFL